MERLKHSEDYPFNRATCQEIVRSVFNKAEVKEVQVLTGGVVNTNLEIALTSPDIQVHLRVYSEEDAEARADKERIIYDLVAKQTDIPVPAIYALDSSRSIVNEVFALQSSLPGINLEAICGELSPDEREGIALQMGEYLGQLHTVYFTKFGNEVSEGAIGNRFSWREFFLEFTSRNITWCEEQGTIDGYLADSLRKHITKWQWLLSVEQSAVLVHRDFHLGNIKVQKDQRGYWRISGIYDFEHAIAGHNEFDLAKPYWTIFEPYPEMREPMLLSYNKVRQLSSLFDLRMNRLYRLAEITDFLVFGITHNMTSEVTRNILLVKEILRRVV